MNPQPSAWLIALVGVLAVVCVLAGIGGVYVVSRLFSDQPVASVADGSYEQGGDSPMATPDPRSGRAPTYTPEPRGGRSATAAAVQPVATGNVYDITVPTPVPQAMAHPIKLTSHLTVLTYAVSGTSVNALTRSLEANALTIPYEPARRYYARTDWRPADNLTLIPTRRGCEVDKGNITLAMTMTLPVLVSPQGLAPDVLSRWNAFIANTIEHEEGHVNLILNGARDYQSAVGNYAPGTDCDTLGPKLKGLFDAHFAAVDRANMAYDAETSHGATQGAAFP